MRHVALALSFALVLLAAPAFAECAEPADPALAGGACAEDEGMDLAALAAVTSTEQSAGDESRLFGDTPFKELRAEAFPIGRFGLWGQKRDYSLVRGTQLVDVTGGAFVRLMGRMRFTAGYRLIGNTAGNGIDLGSTPSLDLSAPFVGFGGRF